jgi:NADPH2:quinone reductase
MKAVVCYENGPIERLSVSDAAAPVLMPGCVRLRMTVAAINPPDILMTRGLYQVKPPVPFVLGVEGAGEVVEVADDVTHLAPGERVMTYAGQGCFAEQAVVPAWRVFRIPEGMSDEAGSGFVLAYGTVFHSLVDCGELAEAQTLVVLGAAGGLGMGAVIAVASTPEKRAKCLENGADEAIDNDPSGLRDRIRGLTGGRGADVILDLVGGELTDPALRAIAPYGRFVIAGYASGQIPQIKANLILLKQAKVIGASYRIFAETRPDAARANMEALCALWRQQRLHPQVSRVCAFADIRSALRVVAERQAIGKVAVRIAAAGA